MFYNILNYKITLYYKKYKINYKFNLDYNCSGYTYIKFMPFKFLFIITCPDISISTRNIISGLLQMIEYNNIERAKYELLKEQLYSNKLYKKL